MGCDTIEINLVILLNESEAEEKKRSKDQFITNKKGRLDNLLIMLNRKVKFNFQPSPSV